MRDERMTEPGPHRHRQPRWPKRTARSHGGRRLVLIALGKIVLAVSCLALHETAYAQSRGAVQIGVYQGPQLPTFKKFIGRKIDRVVDFLDLRTWKVMRKSAVWTFDCWKNQPAALTISVPMLPKDGTSTLKAGADGAYDGVFREVARLAVESCRDADRMGIQRQMVSLEFPAGSHHLHRLLAPHRDRHAIGRGAAFSL